MVSTQVDSQFLLSPRPDIIVYDQEQKREATKEIESQTRCQFNDTFTSVIYKTNSVFRL